MKTFNDFSEKNVKVRREHMLLKSGRNKNLSVLLICHSFYDDPENIIRKIFIKHL